MFSLSQCPFSCSHQVLNLEGSIVAWTHIGLPLVQRTAGGNQPIETKRVHVYSPGWALQAKGYTPVFLSKPTWAAWGVGLVTKATAWIASVFYFFCSWQTQR